MKKLKDKIKETWEDSPALTILSTAAIIGASAYFLKSTAELMNSSVSMAYAMDNRKATKHYRSLEKARKGI